MSGLCALQAYDSSEADSSGDEDNQPDQCRNLGLTSKSAESTAPVLVPDGNALRVSKIDVSKKINRPRSRQKSNDLHARGTSEYLPLPDGVMSMFCEDDAAVDDLSEHQGRIRSFPHEAGNWATYVYVPIQVTGELEDMISALLRCIPAEFNVQAMDMLHLSVSRTVTLKYHWIRPFTESVSKRLASLPKFICALGKPRIYVNDEATRSFVSLTISQGVNDLQEIVKEVDLVLDEFNLPAFYKPPSFHVSIGWCLGDLTELSTNIISDLEKCFVEHLSSVRMMWNVKNLCSKIGNKHFTFPLR